VDFSTAAVIVHYYGGASITACVRSLQAGTAVPGRIIVIDNGSDPGWEEDFRCHFPEVLVVRSPRNLGFAGALPANVADYAPEAGASEASLLILNQDTELDSTCLARLEDALRHPSIGVVCPLVVDHAGRIAAAGGTINAVTGRAGNVEAVGSPRTAALTDVDYAPGCVMLVRADVWRRAGGFDARFFMYFEDADLAVRVRNLGYRVVCDQGAVCRHEGSSAAGGEFEPFQSYFRLRNRALFVSKNFSLMSRTTFWVVVLPLLLLRDAYRYAKLGRWPAFRQVLAGLRTVWHPASPPARLPSHLDDERHIRPS
jgi:GT2 family glycosyltransferase